MGCIIVTIEPGLGRHYEDLIMAHPLSSVTGKVTKPDGTAAGPGKIFMEISAKGYVIDDNDTSVKYEVVGTLDIDVDENGNVSFGVTPNDLITPSATYYKTVYLINGFRWEEDITVNGTSSQDFADLARSNQSAVPTAIALTPASSLPTPSATYAYQLYTDTSENPRKGYVCLPKISGGWAWEPFVIGSF